MIYKKALICKTKNLFSFSTKIGTISGFSNTTPRQFEEGKWYVGISGNNYYAPDNIVEYEFTEDYVYMNTKGGGYGVGKVFKCEANQTYTVSCKWVKYTNNMNISIGFYDENGNYLSFVGANYLAKKLTITTPANCKWFTVCFVGSTGTVYVYNIQLEKGTTPTGYVPYGYLQSYKKAIKVSDNCFVDSYKSTVICKTKNLFDKNNATIINGYIYSGYLTIIESPYDRTIVFPCKPNTTYTFSKMYTNRLFMAETSEKTPAVGTTCTNPIENLGEPPSQNYCTLTTTATAKNLIITVCALYGTETYTLQEVLDSVQIEEGSTATSYVPYGHL